MVAKFDRLARSLRDAKDIVDELTAKHVKLSIVTRWRCVPSTGANENARSIDEAGGAEPNQRPPH